MAKGVNKVILLGRLGGDPESRQAGATTVANFTIATSDKYKDKQDQWQERTEWHRIVAWGKLADICAQYLHKGSQVYVEGKLQTRSWEKEGVKQYTTEVVLSEMQMLDGKPQNNGQDQPYNQPASNAEQQGYSTPQVEKDELPF